MQPPAFWNQPGSLAGTLLSPVAALWAWGARRRASRSPRWMAPVPTLCIGNLVAGGAGKTPVSLALAEDLPGVHLLARGYGGRERGPLRVDPACHDAAAVGDEPLLLAAAGPCWIGRDRVATAQAACAAGAARLLLDDGFQNPDLHKTASWLVVDGPAGFGNGRCLPAGPLREPIAAGLERAAAVVVIGAPVPALERQLAGVRLCFAARLVPDPQAVAALRGREVLAFAGIGRPAKFFATLEQAGARLRLTRAFADHQPYQTADLQPLLDAAARLGVIPVTTAKDAVRLPPDLRAQVQVLPVRLEWEQRQAVQAALRSQGLTG